jgi:hypothetical protein
MDQVPAAAAYQAPAPAAAPPRVEAAPRQAPVQQAEKPPAPMLKYYYDDQGFDRAVQRMRGGMRALTLEEIRGFAITDDTHGSFTIGCPMATFTVDKQNDLKQISQLGSGMPTRLALHCACLAIC